MLDLTEEFYLQTIDIVFQRYLLPKGELIHKGRRVDPSALVDVGLMTVEGENDDISGVGQTQAAHRICTNIQDARRELYVQPGVGHYGRVQWTSLPGGDLSRVRDFITLNEEALPQAIRGLSPPNEAVRKQAVGKAGGRRAA